MHNIFVICYFNRAILYTILVAQSKINKYNKNKHTNHNYLHSSKSQLINQ